METEGIEHKMVFLNGINMHMAEMGQGPLVLFLHGFPELWYSWRHQLVYLAANGYRAVAPDLRGYGDTTGAPTHDITKFTTFHVVGDILALLDAISHNEEKAFVVGHDWGAYIAWHLCLFRPEKVKALVNLSVPYMPRSPEQSLHQAMRAYYGDDHYFCKFQEPGEIEDHFAKVGTRKLMKKFLTFSDPAPFMFHKDLWIDDSDDTQITLPPWLSEQDIKYYVDKFEKTGFTGGVNYYRAIDLSWELSGPWTGARVLVPTKFIVGDLDLVYHMPGVKEFIHDGGFHKDVPFLEDVLVIEGAAHFINQEKPNEINKLILELLQKF